MCLKRYLRIMLLPLLSMLLWQSVSAQSSKTVTGKITDTKDGSPVVGASVVPKGSKSGTTTDATGFFSFKVAENVKTLVISSVGFDAKEVAVGNGNNISVALKGAQNNLNEVVVVAYGTRKKADLTGSVTAVTSKDFQKGAIQSSEQLLQGKVAGLQVTTGGGSAGGGSKIRIRGGASLNASNDPLIVIDGVPVESNGIAGSGNFLNTINPNDIESMSVLKDASATALYGSRASNGVIIITTKKGQKGKIRFNYNAMASVGIIGKKIDVLTGDEMRALINAQGSPGYKAILGKENTDWQKEIYQQALGFDNNLSASGAIGKIPFRASVGYLNQAGTLKTNKFDRISGSLNLNPKFFDDHLAVNMALKVARTNNRWANEGAIGSAVTFDPTQPVYASNKYGGYYEWLRPDGFPIELATRNPLGLLYLRNNTSNVNRFIGNVQVDYKLHFLPDLHVLLNLGMDKAHGEGNDNTDSIAATDYLNKGRFVYYQQGKTNYLADVSLFYTKDLKSINSKLDVLLGHSYQDFYTSVYNYPSYGQNGAQIPGTSPNFATDKPEFRLESYLGRINYTLANKYLITASLRRDASSKFSPANRVGYFPSVAVAWRMNEEFFKNSTTVSDLKLRGSWGVTGQQDGIGYYSYLPIYSQSNSTAQYQFGNNFYSFLRPAGYYADTKWESTETLNLGLDFAFLNNRISGSFDIYKKTTKDLLSEVPIAPGANFANKLTVNVGNIENKGFEFTLNTTPVKHDNFSWDFGFNFAYNENKITNLLKQQDPKFTGIDVGGIAGGTGNTIQKHAVGYAPYSFFVHKQVYDKTTGKPIEGLYEDLNRDGKIDAADRYLYKKGAPDLIFGINTQVNFRKFTFGLAAHGMTGNYVYNNLNSERASFRNVQNPINFIQNTTTEFLDSKFYNNQYTSDYFVENASFFRLDNINIGYNAGRVFNNSTNLRLTASVQNVFIITKYSGLDPELSNNGIDNAIYPRPRIFSLGVNFDF